jgi:thiamine biosynthesis lipoprotein
VSDAYVTTLAMMGTVISIQVVGHGGSARARRERTRAVGRAIAWFAHVESVCTRFDAASELRALSTKIGVAVPASDTLFEALQFAIAVARESDGAFDPTVGTRMEARGFDREYRRGDVVRSGIDAPHDASYRDVEIDPVARTVTLHRPLLLDLGAVAKGLAVDMAARELAPFEDFAVNAGGDLFLGGHNADGGPWSVGIRHPRDPSALLETVQVADSAVCTSGDYERHAAGEASSAPATIHEHHIMNPSTGRSGTDAASVTVIADSAMVADALATAAFVLGPAQGIALLERHGAEGLMITPSLQRFRTESWRNA